MIRGPVTLRYKRVKGALPNDDIVMKIGVSRIQEKPKWADKPQRTYGPVMRSSGSGDYDGSMDPVIEL